MRNYQRKKNNPYLLPHNVYMATLYTIRDYPRRLQNINDILQPSPAPLDSMPKGTSTGKPTEEKALKLEKEIRELRAVENALEMIPDFYRKGVMNNILYSSRYPLGADERTYRTYKQRLIYFTAQNLKKI